MTDKIEATTVLIGGAHDGQPINCVLPPIRTLVMLVGDGGKGEGYTLYAYSKDLDERFFYVLDGVPADEAQRLMRERWYQGLTLDDGC